MKNKYKSTVKKSKTFEQRHLNKVIYKVIYLDII